MGGDMKKVIVDVDAGIDDCMALLVLIYAETIGRVKIEAILCTNGNTTVDNAVKNVVRLLEVVNRTDISVYRGAANPFILPTSPARLAHGKDGFGDLEHDREPDISIVKSTHAAIALHDIINENPGEISVICVGPLTTLGLSLKLYEDLAGKIKDIWIMGGNYMAPTAEFNFNSDPESVHIVLKNVARPIYILPWESCLTSTIPFEWRFETLGGGTPVFDLLTRAERMKYSKSRLTYYTTCDTFLTFCFLDPQKHITKHSKHHATIELHGPHTRGQVILDHLKNKVPNIVVIESFDQDLFQKCLVYVKSAL